MKQNPLKKQTLNKQGKFFVLFLSPWFGFLVCAVWFFEARRFWERKITLMLERTMAYFYFAAISFLTNVKQKSRNKRCAKVIDLFLVIMKYFL